MGVGEAPPVGCAISRVNSITGNHLKFYSMIQEQRLLMERVREMFQCGFLRRQNHSQLSTISARYLQQFGENQLYLFLLMS